MVFNKDRMALAAGGDPPTGEHPDFESPPGYHITSAQFSNLLVIFFEIEVKVWSISCMTEDKKSEYVVYKLPKDLDEEI